MISLTTIACLSAAAYVIWRCIVYPAFVSPLSKIPNAHFSAPFSPFWILWKRYSAQENKTVHAAHEKHGKIVRLGPNDVSVASVDDGIRIIYGGGFEKWAFYPNLFDNFGYPCTFSTAANKPHSLRKRMISHTYSKSHVQSSQEVQRISEDIILKRVLPHLESLANHTEGVEIEWTTYAITMDLISAFAFGLGNGSDFINDQEAGRRWFSSYQCRLPYDFWQGELPSFTRLTEMLGFPVIPSWVHEVNQYFERWMVQKCKSIESSKSRNLEEGKTEERTPSLVYDQLVRSRTSKEPKDDACDPPILHLASELFDHIAAGHHTSGITLTYLYWELSRHPDLQSLLRKELLSLDPPITVSAGQDGIHLPSARAIDGLPFLHALFMETLRIHSAIPGPQPRITPAKPVSVAGSPPLHAGTRISSQAYTLHRNADVFPDPEKWDPYRWLEACEEKKAEMLKWFWAFGSGSRMCIGSNIAMQNMKLVTAAIYTNFTTSIVDDSGIEQADGWTVGPKGKVVLGFHRHRA